MADASSALGAPEVVGAWVTRKGTAKKVTASVAGAEIGGVVGSAVRAGIAGKGPGQPMAGTPEFGTYGYLAASASEIVLVKAKQGLTGLKLTGEVVARVPRGDVTGAELGDGKVSSPFLISFGDGNRWELEVARARRGGVQRFIADLGLGG